MEFFLRLWKWLLSFLKKDWTLDDYPIRIHHQIGKSYFGERIPPYVAQIIGWFPVGVGETPEEAMNNLRKRFNKIRLDKGRLPRPGTYVPFEIASTEGIEAHWETRNRFISEVLGMDPGIVFISDQSSLSDFAGVIADDPAGKVRQVFGVDVTDIRDGNLRKIFERIDAGSKPT